MLEIKKLDCFDEIKQGRDLYKTKEITTIENGDEHIEVYMSTIYHDSKYKRDLMHSYVKQGKVHEFMKYVIGVRVYVYNGNDCREKYNPTVKPGGAGYVLDFDWMLPDTARNRERILGEIYIRIAAEK